MGDSAALREENEVLKREVEALLVAKEIAKDKVRSAIQQLVDENKKLKKKITALEGQVSSLLLERNTLLQRLSTEANNDFEESEHKEPPYTPTRPLAHRRLGSSANVDTPTFTRANTSDLSRSLSDSPDRGFLRGSMDPSDPGSIRNRRNMQSASKLAGMLGLDEDKIVSEVKNVPEPLTIEEPGLLLMRNPTDDSIEVKGGTLVKLIERLYHPAMATQAPEYASTFILTHKTFSTTLVVLPLLVNAYSTFSENRNGNQETRQRILKFLEIWADLQPEDFADLGEYSEEFQMFLKSKLPSIDGKIVAKALRKRIKHPARSNPYSEEMKQKADLQNRSVASPRMTPKSGKAPKAILPKARIGSLEDVDPVELARQMTLLDQEVFQKLRPGEFLNTAWMKKTKDIEAPNVLKMIHRFNEVSLWVQHSIVTCDNVRKRASFIEKFIKIGQIFLKLQNFNGVMQIISALEGAAVYRLSKSFEKVKPSARKKYANMHELMSGTLSYKLYREAMAACTPPCIPYLGVHLTDFATLHETKSNLGPNHPSYLNFSKNSQVANAQRMILRYQAAPYALQVVALIREWLLSQLASVGNTPEEKLYELSLIAEPREDPSAGGGSGGGSGGNTT